MTKSSEFSYWVPEEHERVSFTFVNHVNQTAKVTGRPFCTGLQRDEFGRTRRSELDRVVKKSVIDESFTFDCAARVGLVHLQQIGAMVSAAPTLGEGLDLLTACLWYFDDRMLASRTDRDGATTYNIFYKQPLDPSFYHTQVGALFLTLLDAWPTQYVENSVFHFPRVARQNKTTLKTTLSKFPWCSLSTNKYHIMGWTVSTEQLDLPSPNFNPEWWEHCQKFLRWGLDANSASEPFRRAWCRLTTASMMTDCKNMTVETACKLTGVSNKTLSKKLAAEGFKAADLKTWIITEMTQRACAYEFSEETAANVFGYSVSEFRAGFKRRGVVNPYFASPEEKKRVIKATGAELLSDQTLSVA